MTIAVTITKQLIILIIIDYSGLVNSWKTAMNILIALNHYVVSVDYVGICIQSAKNSCYNNNYSSQWVQNSQFPRNLLRFINWHT